MNKHIELVRKWLADPDSVTQKELEKNRDAADYSAAYAAWAVADWAAAAFYAAAAADAAYYSAAGDTTAYWVKKYEALEQEDE